MWGGHCGTGHWVTFPGHGNEHTQSLMQWPVWLFNSTCRCARRQRRFGKLHREGRGGGGGSCLDKPGWTVVKEQEPEVISGSQLLSCRETLESRALSRYYSQDVIIKKKFNWGLMFYSLTVKLIRNDCKWKQNINTYIECEYSEIHIFSALFIL